MKIQRPLTPPVQLQSKARPDDDYGQAVESGISDQAKLGIAAGWVGLTTAAGAVIGHQRGLSDVVTIERIGNTALGRKVQQAWLEDEVVQCGYCQCGQIMSAVALLEQNPQPDDRAIDQGMAGNLCRCCTYTRIRSAIKRVAQA